MLESCSGLVWTWRSMKRSGWGGWWLEGEMMCWVGGVEAPGGGRGDGDDDPGYIMGGWPRRVGSGKWLPSSPFSFSLALALGLPLL